MTTKKPTRDELEGRYVGALQGYFLRSGEAELHHAYELGRQAVADGLGILDLIAIHDRAIAKVLVQNPAPAEPVEVVRKAGEFFTETMSPFEMTHRAFEEANAALSHVNDALEKEAKRIAHALHDDAGQLLAAVYIKLDEICRGSPPGAQKGLREVQDLLGKIEEHLRQLSHELRPTILDDLGLVPALEFLADGVSKRTGLPIAVEGFKGGRLPPSIETALYRIIQEALTNVMKHARASRVHIRLRRTRKAVRCSVADDGIGFRASDPLSGVKERGLGIIGIRERLNALEGSLRIISAQNRGTELQITVPIAR